MLGSLTTPGRGATCDNAATRVAFRSPPGSPPGGTDRPKLMEEPSFRAVGITARNREKPCGVRNVRDHLATNRPEVRDSGAGRRRSATDHGHNTEQG